MTEFSKKYYLGRPIKDAASLNSYMGHLWGEVTAVSGSTAICNGFKAPVGALCEITIEDAKASSILAEVVAFSEDGLVLMPFDDLAGVCHGSRVRMIQKTSSVKVGPQLKGRVIDPIGNFLDKLPPPDVNKFSVFHGRQVQAIDRRPNDEPLDVGVRVVNSILTLARGQRVGLVAGSGVGKSSLLAMMTKHTTADIVIVVLVGERGREATEFIDETLGQAGLENSVVVLATSEASPVLRRKANDTGHTIAEYFRDQGLNVLLLVDSLTRVAHAEREIGLSAGEPPTSKGYPPSVFSKLPRIMERGGMSDGEGSITSIYTVLLEFEAGDDPIVEVARSSLDGQIMLSREMADAGIYPAVNLKGSISRLSQRVVDKNLTDLARDFRRLWTKFEQNRDLIMVGAYESGSDEELDRAIRMRKEMESFIEQDLSVGCSLSSSTEQLDQLMGRQFSGHEVGHVVKDS